MFSPRSQANGGVLAADGLLDPIEQRDLPQHLPGDGRALVLEALHEAAADMRPAVDQLPRPIVPRDFGQRVVGLIGVALQETPLISGEEFQRMRLAPAGGIMEQNDGRAGAGMAAIIGNHGPEIAALGGLPPRVQHGRAGFIDEDAVRAAQMDAHVVDDRHQMETGAADPVAERAPIQIDPLPLEDLRLTIKRQMIAEFRDDDPGDEQFRRQPARHDVFGRMRLRHGPGAAAAGVSGTPGDQHAELRGDHVQPLGHILADLRHLATAAGALRAGRLDHPLDPGQMRRQMPAVALRLAGRIRALSPQRRLGLLLGSLEHALGQLGVFQGQVELVRRQLFGALAELLALRCAQDVFQPAIGLLRLGQCRLDLGEARFQQGIFPGKSGSIHAA